MLKGISPVISPKLLYVLARMGHGDEIVLADSHFPGYSFNPRVIDASGARIPELLRGIIPLFELDCDYGDRSPLIMMLQVVGDELDPSVELSYRQAIKETLEEVPEEEVPDIVLVERFTFYARAKGAFAVVMTGDTAKYGNIMLRKGVTPA